MITIDSMRNDAKKIIDGSISAVIPDSAVKLALESKKFEGDVILIAIGKAAWQMANTAKEVLKEKITSGIVITKYNHSNGDIDSLEIVEAGHPILDENTIEGTKKAIELINDIKEKDTVLFLVSGGGSALFEKPIEGVTLKDMEKINQMLLASGADIIEINTIRKRLSSVKGGRFGQLVAPNYIFSIVLSDVVGDRLDSIASGPAYPDSSTYEDVENIIKKYNLKLDDNILDKLKVETPKKLDNVETIITGSVRYLCEEAAKIAKELGYEPIIATTFLESEASQAGKFIGAIAREIKSKGKLKTPYAIIAGGETVVTLTGKGKGGRNQEIALSAANAISGLENVLLFSVGSDGTDGPTDAAGGIVDGNTKQKLAELNINIDLVLQENDSYNALEKVDGLVITGPTGTNVNDVTVLLCK